MAADTDTDAAAAADFGARIAAAYAADFTVNHVVRGVFDLLKKKR